MERICEEIRLLKKSDKCTVQLVRAEGIEKPCVRKTLAGRHGVYRILQEKPHPCIPRIYEVEEGESRTVVLEEYIEGESLGDRALTPRQCRKLVRELCGVLEYLHRNNIVHRDIKPSNILMTPDGHIRLIDFDAARMPKDLAEQDTHLLGTRGYAPPEQYGFAQTDARSDIYALGVTLGQAFGSAANDPRYRKIIRKCTELDPDKRYQSVRQVRLAFGFPGNRILSGAGIALLLLCLVGGGIWYGREHAAPNDGGSGLRVLPAPEEPHWDGDSGVGVWGNVPECGTDGEVGYVYRIYVKEAAQPPDPEHDQWTYEGDARGNFGVDGTTGLYQNSLGQCLEENGYYYFAVSAQGDGITYADSPFAVSDAFLYTGADAPVLPAPEGLRWNVKTGSSSAEYYAAWDNLDDYADGDRFHVCFYDGDNRLFTINEWSKRDIMAVGSGGVWLDQTMLGAQTKRVRFTVTVYTSRPNEYRSYYVPDPAPEEYYSPWLDLAGRDGQAAPEE